MSSKLRILLLSSAIIITVASTGLFWAAARTKIVIPARFTPPSQQQTTTAAPQNSTTTSGNNRARIGRQPEALKLSRALGKRFQAATGGQSTLSGTLAMGSDEQNVSFSRTPGETWENIDALLGSEQTHLTWNGQQGALSSNNAASDDETLLIERLSLDSPDHFVLAQLSGASYYTVGRNIRPADAGGSDNYTGPTWDIVRVGEPAGAHSLSPWRLYYINSTTGLLDKVVSEIQGVQVVAELSGWTEVQGEKVPSHITWSRQGQVIMQFSLANFSHSNQ
jgi:hypothetical protein